MTFTVRRVSDWRRAKLVWALPVLFLWGGQTAYAQQKLETPQETNEKIQQLASMARTHPTDTPIGTGDLLHIEVFDVPELSREVRVSDVGDISYPLIPGKIQVSGLTTFQLEEKVAQLLVENGLVSHPQVSVFVKEQNSQPVSLVGAVQKPMVYQIIRPTTLLELLANAGGISDEAGSVVIITRQTGAAKADATAAANESMPESQTITIRLQDLLESGNPAFNIAVYGGDVVSVPPATAHALMLNGAADLYAPPAAQDAAQVIEDAGATQ